MPHAISLACCAAIFGLAFWFAPRPRRAHLRLLVVCVALNLGIVVLAFAAPAAIRVLVVLHDGLADLWTAGSAGTTLLLGRAAASPADALSKTMPGGGIHVLFQILPRLIVFGALAAVLHRSGAMAAALRFLGRAGRPLTLSGVELLAALASVFLGVESLLLLGPWLSRISARELTCVFAVGLVSFGANWFAPLILTAPAATSGPLVVASLAALPAAVVLARLLGPRTAPVASEEIDRASPADRGLFPAVMTGAWDGLRAIGGIAVLTVAALGVAALLALAVESLAGLIASWSGSAAEPPLRRLLAFALSPLSLAAGVESPDRMAFAELLAVKLLGTELAGLKQLLLLVESGGLGSGRTVVMGAFALGGFVNLAGLAAFLGAAAALAPSRVRELGGLGARAFLAALLAVLATACLAGAAPAALVRGFGS
jgi:CNT family concentrative nucleoside transporter